MKDALGHGSNAHNTGIAKLPARMTKAHFILLAEQLKAEKPADDSTPEYRAWSDKLSATADRLELSNPGFNRGRFIDAAAKGVVTHRSRASSLDRARKQLTPRAAR